MNVELSGIDSFKGYLNLIRRKKFLFVAAAISVITLFVMLSYLLPKKYEAKSTVFIERNVISSLVKGIAITPSMEDRLRVLSYSMKSRNLLRKVIKALDMDLETKNQLELERLITDFREKTVIDVRKGAREMDLFIISYRDKDPEFARDYVNTLVNMYIEGSLLEKRDEAYGANTFLSEQIAFFKKKLDRIDSEILNFRREKGIFVSVDERGIVSEIRNTEEELEKVKTLKMELQAKKDSIAKQLKGESGYVAVGEKKSAEIKALQNKLNKLLLNYTENYPDVMRIRAEIEALKQGIVTDDQGTDPEDISEETLSFNPVYQDLKSELGKVESELAAMTAREKNLKERIESKKEYLRDIPAEKKTLVDMERQRETDRQIYEALILRHGKSEVSKQMEVQDKGATFNIIDPAVLPIKPVSPNRVMIMLAGIAAGLGGAFGLIFFIDNMDTSVRTVDALKTLGPPVLAVIPSMTDAEDLSREKKKEVLLYGLTVSYILFVLILVALEMLELTYVDQFVTKIIARLELYS